MSDKLIIAVDAQTPAPEAGARTAPAGQDAS